MKTIPAGRCLIVLVGPSGGGKSHLAAENFPAREIVSMDGIREELTGDFRRQDMNVLVKDEFLSRIEVRLHANQRVVADATHIKNKDRRETAEIGEMLNAEVIYLVVDRPIETKFRHAGWRLNQRTPNGVPLIESHDITFRANEITILAGDHVKNRVVIDTRVDEFNLVAPLPRDPHLILPHLLELGYEYVRVVGDPHGNMNGLYQALQGVDDRGVTFFLFLGDVVDYGSETLLTAGIVANLVRKGEGVMVRGNHERKIARYIVQNRDLTWNGKLSPGNDVTINQLKAMGPVRRAIWEDKFLALVEMSPDWIQIGDNTIFTHAAVHHRMWNNTIHRVHPDSSLEAMAMYGQTTGKADEWGRPERIYDWVNELPNGSMAVVGHAARSIEEPFEQRGTQGGRAIFLDTGSSKEIDQFEGREGHLSWMDFDIHQARKSEPKLIARRFGRES